MTRDLALLRLLQLFDSQFPVGAFAHSGGLETYAARGAQLPRLRALLINQVELGWGRGELAAAHLAWRAAAAPDAARALAGLAVRVHAFKVVPVVREASLRLGRRTLQLVQRLYPATFGSVAIDPPHHAVVVGTVARGLGLDARDMLIAYGQSLAAGALASAMRCMPVSPAQAQALLVELHAPLLASVTRAMEDPECGLFTCTPALDIRSHQQAFLHTRLFQS